MKMAAPTELADSDNIKLTEKQKAVLDLIKMTGGTSVKEVCYFTGVTTGVTDALYKKGLIYYYDEEVFRIEDRTKDESLAPLRCQNNSRQPAITSMPNMPIQNRIQAFCSVLQVREKQAFL